MVAYYNENDPFAAQWLKNLINAGHIAPGDVDERSILDVKPSDLKNYTQCHFFAGIGIWSLALRRSGWDDERSVWTGSCPCQPFSAAGKGAGFADERHLWPAFFHLIRVARPDIVLGEQVASKDGLAWLDLVQADMEGENYALGAADTCAAGFGAPHWRQRLYWAGINLADACGERLEGRDTRALGDERATIERNRGAGVLANADEQGSSGRGICGPGQGYGASFGAARERSSGFCPDGRLADADEGQRRRLADSEGHIGDGAPPGWVESDGELAAGVEFGDVANDTRDRRSEKLSISRRGPSGDRTQGLSAGFSAGVSDSGPGPVNGLWRDADWLHCRDGKWRPVEAGTFPLADAGAIRNRVGKLRGSGNALNLAQAQGFVESVIEVLDE